jgi:glucose/arabinose dehydrogenase/chitodextrinase
MLTTLCVVLGGLVVPAAQAATVLPAGFVLEQLGPDIASAVGLSFVADGRIFIAQKTGQVRVIRDGVLLPAPFIDLSAEVNSSTDRGLLGIAVHPDFPRTPYVYLLYTYDPPGLPATNQYNGPDGQGARVSRLVRVTADPTNSNIASTAGGSRTVLLGANSTLANIGNPSAFDGISGGTIAWSCGQAPNYVIDCLASDSPSHSIGTLAFAADGSLLVGNGDGASYVQVDPRATRALDANSLNGKIIRIDPVTGAGRPGNPYFDAANPNSNRSKIIASGLRNPFRFTVDQTTNTVWIGDVGMGEWEEVDRLGTPYLPRDFGWPCYEGPGQQLGYRDTSTTAARCAQEYAAGSHVPPVYTYNHNGAGAAIQVGPVYRGQAYPADYAGRLFFDDFNRNTLSTLDTTTNLPTQRATELISGGGPVQLIAGPDGNLYVVGFNYSGLGKVLRLRYTAAGNFPPAARIAADPTAGSTVPMTVHFAGGGSTDPNGDALTYSWNFGDGTTSTQPTVDHVYAARGSYTASLTVRDPAGATDTTSVPIKVGVQAPVLTINEPTSARQYSEGEQIAFRGTAIDAEQGDLSASIRWSLSIRHNQHEHPDEFTANGATGSFTVVPHADSSSLRLCASVTDADALTVSSCVDLQPRKTAVTVTSAPVGVPMQYDEIQRATPITTQSIVNATRTLSAPRSAVIGGQWYGFRSWSDGGAISHDIRIGSTALSYTATYAPATTACTGAPGVYLYSGRSYTGTCVRVVFEVPDLTYTGIGDNAASSVRLVGGAKAVLYADRNFTGVSDSLRGRTELPNLGSIRIGDDNLSSLRVSMPA